MCCVNHEPGVGGMGGGGGPGRKGNWYSTLGGGGGTSFMCLTSIGDTIFGFSSFGIGNSTRGLVDGLASSTSSSSFTSGGGIGVGSVLLLELLEPLPFG